MKRIYDIEYNKKCLGEYCRTVRLDANLTIEEFAEMSGVTRQTISNFESGRHLSLDIFLKYYSLSISERPEKEVSE